MVFDSACSGDIDDGQQSWSSQCEIAQAKVNFSSFFNFSKNLIFCRGEAFRHQLNLTGKSKYYRRSLVADFGPSLPPSLYSSEVSLPPETIKVPAVDAPINTYAPKTPGPPPPRSWIPVTNSANPNYPEWRSNALSFIFHRSPFSKFQTKFCPKSPHADPTASSALGIPSFFHICLHTILVQFGGIPPDMYRHIPRHILREYVRHSTIHQPLPKEDLLAIWNLDNNTNAVDGELLVTGSVTTFALSRSTRSSDVVIQDWDTEGIDDDGNYHNGNPDIPIPMHTFIALSASFNSSHIPLLPASITHLALLNIPKTPLHLLPHLLPHLIVLDLSYNPWINESHALRIDWRVWVDLEAVALRGCRIEVGDMKSIKKEMSKGRLLDVEIIYWIMIWFPKLDSEISKNTPVLLCVEQPWESTISKNQCASRHSSKMILANLFVAWFSQID